jgi:hypothetical protein
MSHFHEQQLANKRNERNGNGNETEKQSYKQQKCRHKTERRKITRINKKEKKKKKKKRSDTLRFVGHLTLLETLSSKCPKLG